MNFAFIDELSRRLAGALPQGAGDLRRDLEKNFQAILRSSLARLNLVTREEFEVQQAVLARTREKLTELEKLVTELEGRLGKGGEVKP